MTHDHRHAIYILPWLRPPRQRDLGILFLADGNRRAEVSGGGYAAGARNVVAVAEHLAGRPDVATMVACILSPDNVDKREPRFFAEVRDEFERLGAAIETRGALIGAGVRLEVWGDLRGLRARGGDAAVLAGAIEAVVRRTDRVAAPSLRLLLGVGYDRETPVELDVDVVLRTGMEESGVLRLSGLSSHPSILNVATTKLWPEVRPDLVDGALDAAKRRADPAIAPGYPPQHVVDLIDAMSRGSLDVGVRVTIPTNAAPCRMIEALDRLYGGAADLGAVVATHVPGGASRTYGRRDGAPWEVRVVYPHRDDDATDGRFASILAPGQDAGSLVLPARPALGHANVHACGTSSREIVDAARSAVRFNVDHPPLLGGDRPAASGPTPRAPAEPWHPAIARWMPLVEQHPALSIEDLAQTVRLRDQGSCDDRLVADLFTARWLGWARSAGLLLEDAGSRTAAQNYVLTAFAIHATATGGGASIDLDWEPGAELSARCMLAVAAGDDGVFDGVFEGEGADARSRRLDLSARFLCAVVRGDEGAEAPQGNGQALLTAIAAQWRAIGARYGRESHPAVLEGWRASLTGLYRASVSEYAPEVVDNPLVRRLAEGGADRLAAAREIEDRYVAQAPRAIGDRIRTLLAAPAPQHDELRLVLYLCDVADSIAAGLLFRTEALRTQGPAVTSAMATSLDGVAKLVDLVFRLANDVSSFVGWANGERDAKTGACGILLPRGLRRSPGCGAARGPTVEGLSPAARATAAAEVIVLCRRVNAWLEEQLRRERVVLATLWPAMATAVQRGTFVGRRAYQLGHYATLSREDMHRILDELAPSRAARVEEAALPRRLDAGPQRGDAVSHGDR